MEWGIDAERQTYILMRIKTNGAQIGMLENGLCLQYLEGVRASLVWDLWVCPRMLVLQNCDWASYNGFNVQSRQGPVRYDTKDNPDAYTI